MTLVDVEGSVNLLLPLSGVVAYPPTTVKTNSVSYSELVISMIYRHDIYRGYTCYALPGRYFSREDFVGFSIFAQLLNCPRSILEL